MPNLSTIILINSAGFDYVEFPVGSHTQVIGANGHGKSTLLRTVLFFYLGSNTKSDYALHDTKSDFVTHYLSNHPAYLIYEVARGASEPYFHIAVTRPPAAGRIQFHFVDAPYRREYYLENRYVQAIEQVKHRWREAQCDVHTVTSYEEFQQRILGMRSSTFSVFKPLARHSGQISILPRIISGIFTVSQLDADKLKAALTCGVRKESADAELDLALLKSQLETFRRFNRAVRTFLKHENDALVLVDLAEEHEVKKLERIRSIEALVSMAKALPEKMKENESARTVINREKEELQDQFALDNQLFEDAIRKLQDDLAGINSDIKKGHEILAEYRTKNIEQKASEVGNLDQLMVDANKFEQDHAVLTKTFNDERERKEHLLLNAKTSVTEVLSQFDKRRSAVDSELLAQVEKVEEHRKKALEQLEREKAEIEERLLPELNQVAQRRAELNIKFRMLSELCEPAELIKAKRELAEMDSRNSQESRRQQTLRHELELENVNIKHKREEIERTTTNERASIESRINNFKADLDRKVAELENFDGSLARFFQCNAPDQWPHALKTISRDVLFRNAHELEAKASNDDKSRSSLWGVNVSTGKLEIPTGGFDRERLEVELVETRKSLADEQEHLQALNTRYIATVDAFQNEAQQSRTRINSEIEASKEASRKLRDTALHLDTRITDLNNQFNNHKTELTKSLQAREQELKKHEESIRDEMSKSANALDSRRTTIKKDFDTQKTASKESANELRRNIEQSQASAKKQYEEECDRIEAFFQSDLSAKGVDITLIRQVTEKLNFVMGEIERINAFKDEVNRYAVLKEQYIDPLPVLEKSSQDLQQKISDKTAELKRVSYRFSEQMQVLKKREQVLDKELRDLESDQKDFRRFAENKLFLLEQGFISRIDLPSAPFYQPGKIGEYLGVAENQTTELFHLHQKGDKSARAFLNKFDAEILDRKVLGFSPIHEYFDWFIFVGSELRPFVNHRGIEGMKKIQTQEFEQLIRNICRKNADFQDGIRGVNQTAALVQSNLEKNNFVDVVDSVELKVDRVDNRLTQILTEVEEFAGFNFGSDSDLFGKRPDGIQIEKAIDTFERLVREIDNSKRVSLKLTDYFEFSIRVHENGHDMKWRKSLDHIGSTGTDYLVKMLIYLSLIEVFRERAMDSKASPVVHCVMDETGVLAPKYIRNVLQYAKDRGIILITAGHSQQTVGFENWVLVRKREQGFGAQVVLKKVLKCE